MSVIRNIFLAALFVTAFNPVFSPVAAAAGKTAKAYTPLPGSAERREILDAIRLKVRELHELEVIFVVKSMKACNGWAWAHTLPRSKDGIGRYEDFYALLCKKEGRWIVSEIPCTEPENPDCIDSPGYFSKLARRFPGLPASIFPGGGMKR